MELTKYNACICEGGAERTIVDILINNNKLKFSYEDLIDNKLLSCRCAEEFERTYLGKAFKEKITVIRILDSHKEKFKLSKVYENKIKVINVVTAPEIEMLIIINEKKFEEYNKVKSKIKPSVFCKSVLKLKNVKKPNFIEAYFSNVDNLVNAIIAYKRLTSTVKGEYTLADLLKTDS